MKTEFPLCNAHSAAIKARREIPVFDEQASIDHLVWSLENNLDDLIEGHNKTPGHVMANRERLRRILSRFEFLCSALVTKEAAE